MIIEAILETLAEIAKGFAVGIWVVAFILLIDFIFKPKKLDKWLREDDYDRK